MESSENRKGETITDFSGKSAEITLEVIRQIAIDEGRAGLERENIGDGYVKVLGVRRDRYQAKRIARQLQLEQSDQEHPPRAD